MKSRRLLVPAGLFFEKKRIVNALARVASFKVQCRPIYQVNKESKHYESKNKLVCFVSGFFILNGKLCAARSAAAKR